MSITFLGFFYLTYKNITYAMAHKNKIFFYLHLAKIVHNKTNHVEMPENGEKFLSILNKFLLPFALFLLIHPRVSSIYRF